MDVPRGEVLDGSPSLVLVFDARRLVRAGWQRGMQSAASLDAGLFIGAEHILVRPQRLALPAAGVQLEHRASEFQKVRIAGKDPALVAPGTQSVLHQQPPDGAARGTSAASQLDRNLGGEFGEAVATERQVSLVWRFACQRDD